MVRRGVKVPTGPVRADGARFRFVFVRHDGVTFGADTVSALVEDLVVGYADAVALSPADGFLCLVESLAALADVVQPWLVGDLVAELGESELNAVVQPKAEPVRLDVWPHDKPLLLLRTCFAPFTDVPPPSGESIVWLDASSELSFVESIARLGVGELFVLS